MRANRSHDLNRLLDEPRGSPPGCLENRSLGRMPAGRCAQLAGVWTRVECLPLRQTMPHLGGHGGRTPDGSPTEGEPASRLAGAERDSPGIVRLPDQQVAPATRGAGSGPGRNDGRRVLTIAMTAPQQVHTMGARSLNQAVAGAGASFSSRCSKEPASSADVPAMAGSRDAGSADSDDGRRNAAPASDGRTPCTGPASSGWLACSTVSSPRAPWREPASVGPRIAPGNPPRTFRSGECSGRW